MVQESKDYVVINATISYFDKKKYSYDEYMKEYNSAHNLKSEPLIIDNINNEIVFDIEENLYKQLMDKNDFILEVDFNWHGINSEMTLDQIGIVEFLDNLEEQDMNRFFSDLNKNQFYNNSLIIGDLLKLSIKNITYQRDISYVFELIYTSEEGDFDFKYIGELKDLII